MIDLTQARNVKARHDDELMNISGVVGTGLGRDRAGQPVIEVYVERASPELSRAIPAQLEGIPVRIVATGQFEAR